MVPCMPLESLPDEFDEFTEAAVAAIHRAYAVNAHRHDPEVGDDAVVFGIAIYRNSWYLLEQEVFAFEGWSSARPSGSLVIVGSGLRIHVYRCGQDASVDLDGFRLDDEQSSATQRLIAEANAVQLSFDLEEGMAAAAPPPSSKPDDLRELVIVHAGNPDDGCCGIWIGAPVTTDESSTSPWAWVEPLWLIEGAATGEADSSATTEVTPRHDELPEPQINLKPVAEDESENSEEQ